ncbi:hypothetical protein ACJJIX_03945 [Microbulbifer sp. VAAC004]|uniref:hypothetical protein n=1 Tax=unclassified Microbulbifer TaxID=2619833 RepID=UPI00403A1696
MTVNKIENYNRSVTIQQIIDNYAATDQSSNLAILSQSGSNMDTALITQIDSSTTIDATQTV